VLEERAEVVYQSPQRKIKITVEDGSVADVGDVR
jgi:hypothetical protein